MLFKDKLDANGPIVQQGFQDLLTIALVNQTYPTDLLIIGLNGFYNPKTYQLANGEMSSPYMIGPNHTGHSEALHYKYIHNYRTKNIYNQPHSEYLKDLEYSPEKRVQIDKLIDAESLSIQTEMLIYLKIWETTHFLQGLYQFGRILNGEHYDWHFKLRVGEDNTGIATAQNLIRNHIRDVLEPFSPVVSDCFKTAYKSQIRNSIAHSNYSFQGRNIHPNNENSRAKFHQIINLTFDEWIDMFNATMIIYNSYIGFKNEINKHFGPMALENGNRLPIRINKENGSEVLSEVSYRPEFNDWRWAT
jgi:hypothetical protein